MHRIDTPTADPTANGVGKPGFRNGVGPGTAPTELDEDWFNATQEEIATAIEGSGITLSKPTLNQLLRAIEKTSSLAVVRTALANLSLKQSTSDDVQSFASDGDGNMVAVGESGLIYSSSNYGASWTARSAGGAYAGNFTGVAWCDAVNLWVAVGGSGEIQTSPDMVTWTHRAAGSSYSGTFAAVAAIGTSGGGIAVAVAVGAGGEIQVSTNGTTWTRAVTGGDDYNDVIAANGGTRYLACTDSDIFRSTNNGATAWSNVLTTGGGTSLAHIGALVGCKATNAKLHVSTDDGVTWIYEAGAGAGFSGGRLMTAAGEFWVLLFADRIYVSRAPDAAASRWFPAGPAPGPAALLGYRAGLFESGRFLIGTDAATGIYASLYAAG